MYRTRNVSDRLSRSRVSICADRIVNTASPPASFSRFSDGSSIFCGELPARPAACGYASAAEVPEAARDTGAGDDDVGSLRGALRLKAMYKPVAAVMTAAMPVKIPGSVCHQLGLGGDVSAMSAAIVRVLPSSGICVVSARSTNFALVLAGSFVHNPVHAFAGDRLRNSGFLQAL